MLALTALLLAANVEIVSMRTEPMEPIPWQQEACAPGEQAALYAAAEAGNEALAYVRERADLAWHRGKVLPAEGDTLDWPVTLALEAVRADSTRERASEVLGMFGCFGDAPLDHCRKLEMRGVRADVAWLIPPQKFTHVPILVAFRPGLAPIVRFRFVEVKP